MALPFAVLGMTLSLLHAAAYATASLPLFFLILGPTMSVSANTNASASCNMTAAGPGYYCPSSSTCLDEDKLACPRGSANPSFGKSTIASCKACVPPQYSNNPASATCSSCPSGHRCANATAPPDPCPAGSFSSGGTTTCTQCAVGEYQASSGKSSCYQCPSGHECEYESER